jgi:hypothetical protein
MFAQHVAEVVQDRFFFWGEPGVGPLFERSWHDKSTVRAIFKIVNLINLGNSPVMAADY